MQPLPPSPYLFGLIQIPLMKKSALALLLAAAMVGCNSSPTQKEAAQTEQKAQGPNKELAAFFEAYWERNNQLYPLDATTQGDNRYNDQLPNDQTQAFRDTLGAFYGRSLAGLKRFDRATLTPTDRDSYDIFEYEMNTRLEGLKYPTWMLPFTQFGGLPLTLGQFGSGEGIQPFKTVQDYDAWLGRVRGFTVWTDSAISNFRRGMKAGVVLPKSLVVKMVPQMRDLVVTDAAKSLFYGPINRFPKDFSATDKKRLTSAYQEAILTQLVPAYRRMGDFLEKEYLPKARTTTGLQDMPGGPAMYRYLVKYWTTTDQTPEQIHQTGEREVARIRQEIEHIKDSTGFKGDLAAFFTYLRTDKRFMPYKKPEEVLNTFRGFLARIEPNLKQMFGRTPKTKFEIRQTEAFRAASASIEYNQGAADGSRPGIFYVPIVDATTFNTTSGMESTFLHEAIPGHHYQISLQQENPELPRFRRFAWYGAMGEGWALYTESLGRELGLYKDPYMYTGALGDEVHRAIRLVTDVGMHAQGMTREQAIAYSLANEPISDEGATAEIERYMAVPGQALSYKVGALKIRELRAKYEKQLGPKFNLAAFHDALLEGGVMPLAVLEKKMDAWAAGQ